MLYQWLNYKEIVKYVERITKIKPFINKCNWEGIKYPSKNDWKKTEKKNVTNCNNCSKYFALYILFQNITQIVKNKLLF